MDDNFDYIGEYFGGKLKGEDKKQFENKWEHDDSFAKEIAFYLRLKTELKKEKIDHISLAINKDTSIEPKVKRLFSRRTTLSIAASLIFLIGAFFIYNVNWSGVDSGAIAANYDAPLDTERMMNGVLETQGIAADNLDEQKKRMQILDSLYINDKPNCIITSQDYLDNASVSYFERETRLLKGLSLKQINKENYAESKKILEELSSNGDTDYLDIIQWNLSLIHLYEGNTDAAKSTLNEIVKSYPNSKYTENAKKILKEIN